jgi:hypothetical protein
MEGARQRLKILRWLRATDLTLAAYDRGELVARSPAGHEAIAELREALHMARYDVSVPAFTEHQRKLLLTIASRCTDPRCAGECSGGWLRSLRGKDRILARRLASGGLLVLSEGDWLAAHVTALGRIFAADAQRRHGDFGRMAARR